MDFVTAAEINAMAVMDRELMTSSERVIKNRPCRVVGIKKYHRIG